MRRIHVLGTTGEIEGVFNDGRFIVRRIDPRPGKRFSEETVDLRTDEDVTGAFGTHGGGDLRLVADFVRVIRGEKPSLSSTNIADSVNGHLVAFAADLARETGRVVELPAG